MDFDLIIAEARRAVAFLYICVTVFSFGAVVILTENTTSIFVNGAKNPKSFCYFLEKIVYFVNYTLEFYTQTRRLRSRNKQEGNKSRENKNQEENKVKWKTIIKRREQRKMSANNDQNDEKVPLLERTELPSIPKDAKRDLALLEREFIEAEVRSSMFFFFF